MERFDKPYRKAVTALRLCLTTTEPYKRPTESRRTCPFKQRAFPEVRRDKFDEGVILSKNEFAARAIARESPFIAADNESAAELDNDLKLAIEYIHSRGAGIVRDRMERLQLLRRIAKSLEPMRAAANQCKSWTAATIAMPFNIPFTAAIIDAMRWPDVDLPLRYLKGFPVVGSVPDSGVFRPDTQLADTPFDEFMAANTAMVKGISERIKNNAAKSDADSVERLEAAWARTKEEIDEGLVGRPLSRAQMDRKYKRGKWRCIGRGAIMQKGKWRCIDDGKRSKHNAATTMFERITSGSSDFPSMIARRFAQMTASKAAKRKRSISKRKLQMWHGTDDLRAAYRHAPTSQPQFTCVAVWNSDKKSVVYCDVPGHNFGLKSAPANFCRFPEFASIAARRLLWCLNEHYVDDNDTCEPDYAANSGQACLVALCAEDLLGFPFDESKHDEGAPRKEYLGVVTDFSSMHDGIIKIAVTEKRKKKIRDLVKEIRKQAKLASGIASSLFGKKGFMLTPSFSSLGRSCLQPIQARAHQKRVDITPDIDDSLEFIEFVCNNLPPVELPLVPCTREPVVIFTDAEGKKRGPNALPSGHLGFVVYHPEHGRKYAHAPAPESWVTLFDAIEQRQTYIGQFELAAAICPLLSLPTEWLQDRPVEIWIDNSGAIGALIKDYSGVADCARLVNTFHFAAAKAGIQSLWIDYVPSESNPADIPSRLHEMTAREAAEALRDLGDQIPMVLPEFATPAGEWRSYVDIASSIWR